MYKFFCEFCELKFLPLSLGNSDICENSPAWKTSTILLRTSSYPRENNRKQKKNSCVKQFSSFSFSFWNSVVKSKISRFVFLNDSSFAVHNIKKKDLLHMSQTKYRFEKLNLGNFLMTSQFFARSILF